MIANFTGKELTFQLVRGKSISSRVIGYFGAGYYSHIDVVTPHGYLRGARSDEINGMPPGCRDRPQHYEEWDKCTRFSITVTPSQYDRYWDFSDAQLYKPYDSHGLFDTFVLGRNWRDDGAWWCSEWAAANLEAAKIVNIPDEVRRVTPGDCAFIFVGLKARRQEMWG